VGTTSRRGGPDCGAGAPQLRNVDDVAVCEWVGPTVPAGSTVVFTPWQSGQR
jgi:hypothetical protein